MGYYAHTATLPNGERDPNENNWQRLADHLRNVAQLTAPLVLAFAPPSRWVIGGKATGWSIIPSRRLKGSPQ